MYRKGYRFELRVKEYLEKKGYLIIRSSGSHKPCDLVAIKDGKAVLIECKVNRKNLTKRDRQMLEEIGRKYGCRVLLAYRVNKKLFFEEILGR